MSGQVRTHELEVKLLDPRFGDAWALPEYATASSAGMDLRAALEADLVLAPGDAVLVPGPHDRHAHRQRQRGDLVPSAVGRA